ncbi:DrmB family protein [Nocardia sp. NPDC127526]|uniref:DrmB family protein n=1 Tax=Nocardia sp. NPDC127526 TaxID=3345393 RepID=UPI0036280B2F
MTANPRARRTQLLSTYGIGGLFPSETTSFMIAGLDEWRAESPLVSEPRLARSLGVLQLKSPPAGSKRDVPVIRFPEVQICTSCRRIGTIFDLSRDWNVAKCAQCEAKADLTPFRLIVTCRRGHIKDFPYYEWLHKGTPGAGVKHEMRLKALGRTSSLADLVLQCSCGVTPRSLDGATTLKALAPFGKCSGARPWLGPEYTQECAEIPQAVQRGASNVWFPAVRSAISIPPYSEAVAKFVKRHWKFFEDPEAVNARLLENLASEPGAKFTVAELASEIERQRGEDSGVEIDEEMLRRQEYEALLAGFEDDGKTSDFVCLKQELDPDLPSLVTEVRKVTRLREIRALFGFSRLDGVTDLSSDALCALSHTQKNWLPAIEVIGEGVFAAFDRAALAEWAERPFAQDRRTRLQNAANRRAEEFGRIEAPQVDIVKVALHTLAHVIIDQFSLDAGYPAASLRERLFVDENMAGILIYTASSDSAGSLGGVASQADPERFADAMREGLTRLSWCSADPVCIEATGSGVDALNLAACHACVLVPETSCELNNVFLDRALLFGTPVDNQESEGLFSDYPR